MVELVGVSHAYDSTPVLRSLDLTVREREVLVVIGASGSGKSTLLRCVAGLELINDGEIRIEGEPVQRASAGKPDKAALKAGRLVRREVGMVFQDFNLFPHMRVIDNVALAPRLVRGIARSEATANLLAPALMKKYPWRSIPADTTKGIYPVGISWAVPKGNPDLLKVLDGFLKREWKNGDIKRLQDKYFTPANSLKG